MRRSISGFLFACVLALPALAQHAAHDHDHDHAAPDLGNIGKATFASSCNAAAQKEIDRGVALIHSFWYAEAENAFRKAAAADPACGTAWWGVAMANYHPLWAPPTPDEMKRGREAAETAGKVGAKTARERAYIAAINTFYKDADKVDHHTRATAFQEAMQNVAVANAKDNEAQIFYALSLLGTASPQDKSYANQKQAAEILNKVLPLEPEHPGVAHYIIHSFDYPELAALALPAARTYAKLAPGSPHALHMPSHIFTRLGLWDESIKSNLDSSEKAQKYIEQKDPGATSFDDLHAVDYLVYAYLQQQRFDDAKRLVERTKKVKKIDNPNNFAAAYAIAAVPARWILERRAWKEAASLEPLPTFVPWDKVLYAEANHHYARALGGARSGDLVTARAAMDRLAAIQKTLTEQKNEYWAGQVEIQRLSASSWIAFAEKKNDEALTLARKAADLEAATEKHPVTPGAVIPARELLADMLLEAGNAEAALTEVERTLRDSPNRYNALHLAVKASKSAGVEEKSKSYAETLAVLTTQK